MHRLLPLLFLLLTAGCQSPAPQPDTGQGAAVTPLPQQADRGGFGGTGRTVTADSQGFGGTGRTLAGTPAGEDRGFGGTGGTVAEAREGGFGGTGHAPCPTWLATPGDRGFGGTGHGDCGLGGTGVIGAVTAFGSIWVNGLEIEWDHTRPVTDNLGSTAPLARGHQVIVRLDDSGRRARSVSRFYPLAGRIETVSDTRIEVAGQQVILDEHTQGLRQLRPGQYVAISGWPLDDDRWLAARIDANPQQHTLQAALPRDALQSERLLLQGTVAAGRLMPYGLPLPDQAALQDGTFALAHVRHTAAGWQWLQLRRLPHWYVEDWRTLQHLSHTQREALETLNEQPRTSPPATSPVFRHRTPEEVPGVAQDGPVPSIDSATFPHTDRLDDGTAHRPSHEVLQQRFDHQIAPTEPRENLNAHHLPRDIREHLRGHYDTLRTIRGSTETLRESQEHIQENYEALQDARESSETLQEAHEALKEQQETLRESQEHIQENYEALRDAHESSETLQETREALKEQQETLRESQEHIQENYEALQDARESSETLQETHEILKEQRDTLEESRERLEGRREALEALREHASDYREYDDD